MLSRPLKSWLRSTGHVSGLWALAVAQPLLDILGRAPEFFVAYRADTPDILALAALLVLVPPLALGVIIGAAAIIGRRTADGVTAFLAGALLGVFSAQVGYRLGAAGWPAAAAIWVTTTGLGTVAWLRVRAIRATLTVMASAVVIVPLVFVSTGGIRQLLRSNPAQVAERSPSRLAPVVLIVFDELPLVTFLDGHGGLDATRYPNIAALAEDGIWFRNATTVSDFTRWALPAILTGRYPKGLSVPSLADHPSNLFTRLASSRRMEVIEPSTALCPAPLCGKDQEPRTTRLARMLGDIRIVALHVVLPPAARAGLPDVTQDWAGFDDSDEESGRTPKRGSWMDRRATALAFLDGITRADSQPTLYFLHTLVAHHPPRWLPSGQVIANFKVPSGAIPGGLWTDAAWPVAQYQQGHLVQAGFADTLIGRLRARLQEAGLYDRALVVITADHGISFNPGDQRRAFTMTNAGEILPVPLIVKIPADRRLLPAGTIDDRNIETIDILPTIADGLGIDLPWLVDGTSALRERPVRAEKRIYHNMNTMVSRFSSEQVAQFRGAAAGRKAALFGTGPWPVPSPPGLESLLGRTLDSFAVQDATNDLRVQVDNTSALDDVDLTGPALPVQLRGRVRTQASGKRGSVSLAIAVNDRIVATTRTWTQRADWMALIPPDSLRNGWNDLEVFAVDPARPHRLLRTSRPRRSVPAGVDLLFDDVARSGVTFKGFQHIESAGGTPFHWTDGEAAIRVPIDPSRGPRTLGVDVLFAGKDGKRLRILLDKCEVLSEVLPLGRWSRTIGLGQCVPRGRWMTIRLLSDTHRPGDQDKRRLGIAVSRIMLR